MNFCLTEEQRALQEALGDVLRDRCGSKALQAFIETPREHDESLWKELGNQGTPGIAIPEAYGGLGLSVIELALASECLGHAAAPVPLLSHWLAAFAIAQSADEAQKARWLPDLASGKRIASVAFGEAHSRWLPEQWTIEPGRSVTGEKHYVPAAAAASLFVVGLRGGALGVVEAKATGVSIKSAPGIDRTRSMGTVRFDAALCEVLAAPPDTASRTINAGLALIAADAFGGALRCLEMAVEYAKVREQFGRKIGAFQALRHQLANLANEVEPCRGLYWFGAYAQDRVPEKATHAASLAKAHVGTRFLEAARNAIKYHGGVGFTWDFDCHIWLKRAMFDQAWLGNADLHYLRAADNAGW